MRTIPHPILGLTFAPHVAHLGNALRDQSPRSEINVAFEQCLRHDAALAHELLEALNGLLVDFDALCIRTGTEGVGDHEMAARRAIAKAEAE